MGFTRHMRENQCRGRVCIREKERGGGAAWAERERERDCRKSQHITGQTRRKVVLRIALISPPLRAFLFQASGNIFSGWNHKGPRFICGAAGMEWNEVDLVQEFTVEGQCSKIKVRSCRITWDSLQVNTAQREADRMIYVNVSWGLTAAQSAGCCTTEC